MMNWMNCIRHELISRLHQWNIRHKYASLTFLKLSLATHANSISNHSSLRKCLCNMYIQSHLSSFSAWPFSTPREFIHRLYHCGPDSPKQAPWEPSRSSQSTSSTSGTRVTSWPSPHLSVPAVPLTSQNGPTAYTSSPPQYLRLEGLARGLVVLVVINLCLEL